jgi:hypothetical protein
MDPTIRTRFVSPHTGRVPGSLARAAQCADRCAVPASRVGFFLFLAEQVGYTWQCLVRIIVWQQLTLK